MSQETLIEKFSTELSGIIERASKSIVLVQGRRFPTSGIVWQKNLVITADHSLPKAEEIQIRLSEGEIITASLVGRDPATDIAILRTTSELPMMEIQSGVQMKTGQLGVNIGRANGGRLIATLCMVSGADSHYRNWRNGTLDQFIRLDTGNYPGFSGSAFLLPNGKVAGMNTSVFSRHFGLVVPASNIERLIERLQKKGSIGKPHLGLMMQPVPIPEKLRTLSGTETGLLVVGTEKGSPAEEAGLWIGDIIVRLNEKNVNSILELSDLLTDESIGKEMKIDIIRGGNIQEVKAKVGERPFRRNG